MDDLVYYDTECARHATIKSALKEKLAEPPLVVYMDANPLEAARMISMLKSTYGDSGTEGEGAKPEGA
jgi:ribosomal protein L10